ncbi:alkene reductase [Bdellovibrio sp. SKB1291214]|uniref:alkene reductase n=1 Tax=Bdellovibrio sp. SKB1291214 TaxID=1732569 RepID=UPI000B5191DC|nr:alkene reductase [Bdellovibrio sp. SKB1291214]UYL07278.1 alkene reductase [Bdellovibrio sp. SKB1291214]
MSRPLFEPVQMGRIQLSNRLVMAPMTRSRAVGNLANDMIAKYYADRATAGLIITEGISPSPNGLGYARIPGLFNQEQVASWKKVTDAVHAKGGHIFVQLMHTGRASHPDNLPKGAKILAPSPIALSGKIWTDTAQQQPYPTPNEMTLDEIKSTIQEYITSAELAIQAGFDGVELHGANGYLIEQFLNPNANKRSDMYGGSPENRMRFVLEIAKGTVEKIGGDRLGIRVSPYGVFNDTGAFEGINEFYSTLSQKLSDLGLVYIHVVDHSAMGAPPVNPEIKQLIRQNFKGLYITSGGYDEARAQQDLKDKKGDLVAIGRPYISNPDLLQKLKEGKPLTPPDPNTFYTPGDKGYNDYK